jgi:aminopeptidase N
MITLGDTRFATDPALLVHEISHQWYGDTVTPLDWRDVWMNEGMATYLGIAWSAASGGKPLEAQIRATARAAASAGFRSTYGPPADYDPASFTASNVYSIPAVMWDEVRRRLGDDEFWRLARRWPASHTNANADYAEITRWWSEHSGEDLTGLFDAWLLGPDTPARAR